MGKYHFFSYRNTSDLVRIKNNYFWLPALSNLKIKIILDKNRIIIILEPPALN